MIQMMWRARASACRNPSETRVRPARGRRAGEDRGSAMMLMPAGVLIVIVLGSIAVDFAIAFLAQREVSNLAAAAAHDAAAVAVDMDHWYETGEVVLDQDVATTIVDESIARRASGAAEGITHTSPELLDGGTGVRVEVSGRASYIFTDVIPGAPSSITVSGSAEAEAVVEAD